MGTSFTVIDLKKSCLFHSIMDSVLKLEIPLMALERSLQNDWSLLKFFLVLGESLMFYIENCPKSYPSHYLLFWTDEATFAFFHSTPARLDKNDN